MHRLTAVVLENQPNHRHTAQTGSDEEQPPAENDAREGRLYVFPQGKGKLADAVADRLRQRQVVYSDLRIEHGRLDEVFRRITTEGQA